MILISQTLNGSGQNSCSDTGDEQQASGGGLQGLRVCVSVWSLCTVGLISLSKTLKNGGHFLILGSWMKKRLLSLQPVFCWESIHLWLEDKTENFTNTTWEAAILWDSCHHLAPTNGSAPNVVHVNTFPWQCRFQRKQPDVECSRKPFGFLELDQFDWPETCSLTPHTDFIKGSAHSSNLAGRKYHPGYILNFPFSVSDT